MDGTGGPAPWSAALTPAKAARSISPSLPSLSSFTHVAPTDPGMGGAVCRALLLPGAQLLACFEIFS